jgi:hypothetical protein
MKRLRYCAASIGLFVVLCPDLTAARHSTGPVTPFRATTKRGQYTIETVGDTLGQAKPENTRIILRISGPDHKLVKPVQISLVDKTGTVIKPVFREDRKVGHEENTGLPMSMNPQADTSGFKSMSVGINLNKIFGSHGDYAYTKVDWPKQVFTADKSLQIVMPGGQAVVLPITAIAK